MTMSAAKPERKRLDRYVRKSVHSPNWALQTDETPKPEVQNGLRDSDERQNHCHSAVEHLTLLKSPNTWGISV